MTDWKSTSSYCNFVGSNFVSWCSKKQTVIAQSSAEAKFEHEICEMYICGFLRELGLNSPSFMRLCCDSKTTNSIVDHPV